MGGRPGARRGPRLEDPASGRRRRRNRTRPPDRWERSDLLARGAENLSDETPPCAACVPGQPGPPSRARGSRSRAAPNPQSRHQRNLPHWHRVGLLQILAAGAHPGRGRRISPTCARRRGARASGRRGRPAPAGARPSSSGSSQRACGFRALQESVWVGVDISLSRRIAAPYLLAF